jgi:hypothetical protein
MHKNCHARSKQRAEKLRKKRGQKTLDLAQLVRKVRQGITGAVLHQKMLTTIKEVNGTFEYERVHAGKKVNKGPNQRQKRKQRRQQPHGHK